MIRFVDGFDFVDFFPSGLPYALNAGIFEQGDMLTGQHGSGRSWWIFNTGFGMAEYEKLLDPQPIWVVNFWFRPLIFSSGSNPQIWRDSIFYKIRDSIGTLFHLRQNTDGTVSFRGSASELLATLGPFPVGDWAAIQVKVTATAWTIRVNGVQVATGAPGVWRQPDRFMFRWDASGGLNLDSYVLNDGQGSDNTNFLPYPWRVDSLYPIAVTSNAWSVNVQTDALKCVGDRHGYPPPGFAGLAPDGDLGYLKPTAGGQRALFQVVETECVGRVLGVALSIVAKPTAGSPTVQLVVKQTAVVSLAQPTLAARTVQLPGLTWLIDYSTYLGITERQEDTDRWNVGAISRAEWGVESDIATVRVTQIFVQVVTTTANLSYDCGGAGNYAY